MTENKQYDNSLDGVDKEETKQAEPQAKNYDSSIDGIDKKDDSLTDIQKEKINHPAQESDGRGE
ncbi:hypothetical protein [Macrococcus brunensis]|uniref:hypothetical protein n=1 Tax=Macrococcus brunensis TaxID=198483 RepID=UPI001EF02A55|nr:hypothetical protein [Macrococcus brunensis]ULG71749.1 hypothetical protein MGG12_10725 [Macrococcus brunensis]